MGYTHYWHRPEEMNKDKFKKASQDCKSVTDFLRTKGTMIQFESDTPEPPVFDDTEVRFNGVDDEGHETFCIQQTFEGYRQVQDDGKLFEFCKTAFKQYDIAVTACLIVFKHHFGDDFRVSSDGNTEDWLAGKDACQAVLGYGEVPF
jgi:hypothetical protein